MNAHVAGMKMLVGRVPVSNPARIADFCGTSVDFAGPLRDLKSGGPARITERGRVVKPSAGPCGTFSNTYACAKGVFEVPQVPQKTNT